jgi:hypothetical protein
MQHNRRPATKARFLSLQYMATNVHVQQSQSPAMGPRPPLLRDTAARTMRKQMLQLQHIAWCKETSRIMYVFAYPYDAPPLPFDRCSKAGTRILVKETDLSAVN